MSELENFVAELPQEGQDAFAEPEKETPSESPAEEQPTDDTAKTEETISEESSTPEQKVDDKPKPFHEDPAIQEYISRQVDKRVADKLPELEQSISQKFPPQETNIPSWFGGDEAQWRAYQADQQGLVDKAKREAVAEFESRSKAEQERIAQANSYVESQISALQSDGKKFDRNELLKVVSDYRPVNESGNWDFQKAYEIYELKKAKDPEKSKARKALADSTTSNTKAEPTASKVATYEEVKKKGWLNY